MPVNKSFKISDLAGASYNNDKNNNKNYNNNILIIIFVVIVTGTGREISFANLPRTPASRLSGLQ